MDQTILACNDQGNFLEYIPRNVGHTGEGKRHKGVTILVYNQKGQVLLQRRKHKVFDNIWCFSADTHPYHLDSGDESLEEASKRSLKEDFNIGDISLKNLGFYNYFAKDGELCENENCVMMVGEYNGEVSLNPNSGYEYMWMENLEFLKDFEKNSKKYAPWVPGGLEILKQAGFFD